ncbi:hypothetical protein [Pseudomonas sp. MPC6]|uniref:hypothetical protein n=1 Tax=unclassified Pseudomonas TaxID=196821 RepID=UPI001110393F|nr:hypothetical protein [Pseudomonas sp. MPC6]QCY12725.1 hypothetical protein ELQ88_19140 [Pseudomonas sp. MPC6]
MPGSAPETSPENARELVAPHVPAALPDVPGGDINLIPASALVQPLKVTFPLWQNSLPSVAFPERVRIFLDDDEVAAKHWTVHPIQPEDLFVNIPSDKWANRQGPLVLRYDAKNWSGDPDNPTQSYPVTITIDTRPPILAATSKLQFPPDILPPQQLTAYYLEDEDKVRAHLPAYTTPKVGDVIAWYWDRSLSGTTLGGTKELNAQDYDQPLFIDIGGDWIRSQDDGERYVWYTITDRAGNPPSGLSQVQMLIVKAQPHPRSLPPAKVVEASGTGWPVRGTLEPTDATGGVNVILNPASELYPGEIPQVQWGVARQLGAYLADPISVDEWKYKIPKEYMAPHFGKAIPVVYHFKDKFGKPHESVPYTLTVLNYPANRLPAPESADGLPLSLDKVPPEGASIVLRRWPFSAGQQRISIFVEGIEDSSGKTIRYAALDKHEVTPAQAIAGIARGEALMAKADFLSRIRLGSQLTVKAYISFDNGQTWNGQAAPNPASAHLPWLKVTLVA